MLKVKVGVLIKAFRLTMKRYDLGKIYQLEVGDTLYQYNDNNVEEIKLKTITEDMGKVQTYIIKVEHNHNFFANNILVHNNKNRIKMVTNENYQKLDIAVDPDKLINYTHKIGYFDCRRWWPSFGIYEY